MMKNRSHRYDINSPRSRHIVQELSHYDDGYMLEATFEAQFMRKLSSTEAELKQRRCL